MHDVKCVDTENVKGSVAEPGHFGRNRFGPAPVPAEPKERKKSCVPTLIKGKLKNKSLKINEFFLVRRVGRC